MSSTIKENVKNQLMQVSLSTKQEKVKFLYNEITKEMPPYLLPMVSMVLPCKIEELSDEKINEIVDIVQTYINWIRGLHE